MSGIFGDDSPRINLRASRRGPMAPSEPVFMATPSGGLSELKKPEALVGTSISNLSALIQTLSGLQQIESIGLPGQKPAG